MNGISCSKCGGTNPPNAAFCGTCGAPLAAQQPSSSQPASTGGQPPPAGFQPVPASQPPPAGYPPQFPAPKVMGDNTKWALGLGVAAFFCCGPVAGIPGMILAKKDMDAIASGQAPHLNESSAKGAFYLNIICLILFVVGLCIFWGLRGMRRF